MMRFGMHIQPQLSITIQQLPTKIVREYRNMPVLLIQNAFDGMSVDTEDAKMLLESLKKMLDQGLKVKKTQ